MIDITLTEADDTIDVDLSEVMAVEVTAVRQEVVATPTKERQEILPEENKLISKVIIEPIPDEFIEVGDTTATAEDVLEGKLFYTADGVKTEGVLPKPVPNMLQMLVDARGCSYLCRNYLAESIDFLKDLDTSNVTDFDYMFYKYSGTTQLRSIPKLDMSSVTACQYMFYRQDKLMDLSNFEFIAPSSIQQICRECSALISTPKIDMRNCTTATNAFYSCGQLTNVYLYNINTAIDIGGGALWGTRVSDESLFRTCYELWDRTSETSKQIAMALAVSNKTDTLYVKLIDITDDMRAEDEFVDKKKPCVLCESTDEGAMSLREYVVSKNWSIA